MPMTNRSQKSSDSRASTGLHGLDDVLAGGITANTRQRPAAVAHGRVDVAPALLHLEAHEPAHEQAHKAPQNQPHRGKRRTGDGL